MPLLLPRNESLGAVHCAAVADDQREPLVRKRHIEEVLLDARSQAGRIRGENNGNKYVGVSVWIEIQSDWWQQNCCTRKNVMGNDDQTWQEINSSTQVFECRKFDRKQKNIVGNREKKTFKSARNTIGRKCLNLSIIWTTKSYTVTKGPSVPIPGCLANCMLRMTLWYVITFSRVMFVKESPPLMSIVATSGTA